MKTSAAAKPAPIYDAALAEEVEERQALRDTKAGLVEIRDGTQALMDGLEGAAIGTVRTTCKEILRRQKELTKAVLSLSRVVGGASRQ